MRPQDVLNLIRSARPELERLHGVRALSVFGSAARGDSHEGSDVDVLVAFDGPATSARYFGVQFHLEDLLGRPVDLVTEAALRPELRPHVVREAIRV